jgi:hypothetical protein
MADTTAGSGSNALGWIALIVALASVAAVFYALMSQTSSFGTVATLVLVGIVAFAGFASALSVTASRLGILDAKQPFGLPEGTVRAMLTFAFIVLVGVFASYLLVQSSRNLFAPTHLFEVPNVAVADATAMQTRLQQEGVVVLMARAGAAGQETVTVRFYPRTDYRLADDVAKQILTMLSTMLAAMIGFYFGSRPNETAVDPDAAERLRALAELDGLRLRSPTIDEARKAADEKSETGLTDEQKKALKAIRDRIAAVALKLDAARSAAADRATPISKVRISRAAAEEALATLAAELKALETIKPG